MHYSTFWSLESVLYGGLSISALLRPKNRMGLMLFARDKLVVFVRYRRRCARQRIITNDSPVIVPGSSP